MKLLNSFVTTLTAICSFSLVRAVGAQDLNITGKFIVVLKDGISARSVDSHIEWVREMHLNSLGRRELDLPGVEDTFAIGSFQAYSGSFDEDTLQKIRDLPEVDDVEPEQIFTVSALVTQADADYGLASLSSRTPGAKDFRYDESAGDGTFAYVIDTGIQSSHADFGGRVTKGYSVTNSFDNPIAHGTMVAGVLGSTTYGVAKDAEIIDVRIFDNSDQTSTSNVLRGFVWAVEDIRAKARARKSIINMSLTGARTTGSKTSAVNRAVEGAFKDGILTIVAAGNERSNVDGFDPSSAPNALTVGAIDESWKLWSDSRGGSNFGKGIDILAPGADVLTISSKTDEAVRDAGTSLATPYVSGLALSLAALENFNSPQEWIDRIKALGTPGQASGLIGGTVNLVAYNGASG